MQFWCLISLGNWLMKGLNFRFSFKIASSLWDSCYCTHNDRIEDVSLFIVCKRMKTHFINFINIRKIANKYQHEMHDVRIDKLTAKEKERNCIKMVKRKHGKESNNTSKWKFINLLTHETSTKHQQSLIWSSNNNHCRAHANWYTKWSFNLWKDRSIYYLFIDHRMI